MSVTPSAIRSHSSGIDRRKRSGGFALLVTVTLLAFLVLLLVSLASLTRVETQVATNTQQVAQARQNALMALNMAIGQLQKHAGPDQRVTARADVIAPDNMAWSTLADPEAARLADEAVIGNHWTSAPRNRHWTGVWLNANNDSATYNANTPAAFNPDPELQAWLVSGNENAPDTFKPTDAVTGLNAASTPFDRITDANGKYHRLLLKTAAGVTDAASLERSVTAPEVPILASSVPGVGSATLGHYAWWIGDEGVKARANLVDPYADDASAEAKRIRLQSAQRTAIEAMTTSGADGLATGYPANDTDLANVFTTSQLGYLSTTAAFPAELKARYHDLTVTSRGVLADVKNGGLKTDLSYLFGQPDIPSFLTALRASYGTNAIAPLNTTASSLSANILLNDTGTLLARLPSSAPDGGDYTDKFINTATWEQLWSFANQGAAFNSNGEAIPRNHSATQHGLYPLVIHVKLFYRLRFVGGSPDPDGVNRSGTLSVDTIPVVLLANPYAVPLAPADYQLRISGSSPQLVFGSTDSTDDPDDDFIPATGIPKKNPTKDDPDGEPAIPWPGFPFTAPDRYYGDPTLVLRTEGMKPGEAQIFTIDPSPSENPTIDGDERIQVTTGNDKRLIVMKNEFDPIPAITYNSVAKIPNVPIVQPDENNPGPPTPKTTIPTRAALRMSNSNISTRLYIDHVAAQGDRRLVQHVNAQGLRDDAFAGNFNYTLVVNPMADGIRQGGGVIAVINQPPTTDNPAARPGRSSVFFSHQQAPFAQVNYRAQLVTYVGNSTYNHPLEWARRFVKNGSTGSPGNSPNPWIGANLLRPSGSTTTARWGLVNIGEGQNQTVPPASIGGAGATDVGYQNLLYDVPRPGQPLSSLGQLQHFNTTGYIPDTSHQGISVLNSWQTNYPVSNSYPQPRVPRDQVFNFAYIPKNGDSGWSLSYHFDGSTLWNDLLWDRFTVSSYPQIGDFDFANEALVNARYRPFRDTASVAWNDETAFRGDEDSTNPASAHLAAKNLLVDGAFNINSTSVEAWKAVLSSLKDIPTGSKNDTDAPFPRTLSPIVGSAGAETGIAPESWKGFRDLPRNDIQALAEEIVMQIRKRGPFTSLSHFVNRRLVSALNDPLKLGLSGAVQASLDRTVNDVSRLAPAFQVTSSETGKNSSTNLKLISFADLDYILPSALASFPGYVLQGDVLSALGSSLSARSDTFTIRAYGDSMNPATNELNGQAWCEAVVQRLPDYTDPDADAAHEIPAAGTSNATFGRRFQIVSFRWLSPDEI